MIDWPYVARNALWILGLSIALAGASYAGWWAAGNNDAGERVRRCVLWSLPIFTRPVAAGLALFCAGLAWGSTPWWETALWAALGVAFVAQFVQAGWKKGSRFRLESGSEADAHD